MNTIILLNSILMMLLAAFFIYQVIGVIANNERVTAKTLVVLIIGMLLLMLHPIYFIGFGPNNPFTLAFGCSEGLVVLLTHSLNVAFTALLALFISGGAYLIKKRFL